MAGWSMVADDGSVLYNFESPRKVQKKEHGPGSKEAKKLDVAQCLFEQVLTAFLNKMYGDSCYRPLPAMLGDGRCVDLFKLFFFVRGKGGYDLVLNNGLWDSVTEGLELGVTVASGLKLIYRKYLHDFEKWLDRVLREKKSGNVLGGTGVDTDALLLKLGEELNNLLCGIVDENGKGVCDDRNVVSVFNKNESKFDLECGLSSMESISSNVKDKRGMIEMGRSKKGSDDKQHFDMKKKLDGKKSCNDFEIKNVLQSDVTKNFVDTDEDVLWRKRKRESMQRMLNWVTEIAKNPINPSIGVMPECPKWKSYGNDVLWKQVLSTRENLFLKRDLDPSVEQSIWQKKQRMHPSMYSTGDSPGFTEQKRFSQRLLSVRVPNFQESPEASQATQSDKDETSSTYSEGNNDQLTEDSAINMLINKRRKKRIKVGDPFQANVQEWTSLKAESDSKWLGTQIWPLGKYEKISLIERERTGKGRQDSCGCSLPGSGECVAFHIGERRMRLKLELGSAFYKWKFHKMGEDVALSWKVEDEKKFRTVVMSKSEDDKCFWKKMFNMFPSRSTEDLVSYYFNVFLLRRRGDQNRLTPARIDSDDEDSEDGPVTNVFGREVDHSSGSIFYSPTKTHK